MKILSLSHTYPLPPDEGSRVRLWNMSSRLVDRHDLRLVTTGMNTSWIVGRTLGGEEAVEPPWIHAWPAAGPRRGLVARISRLASGVALGLPPWLLAGMSRGAEREIRRACLEGWPDVVVVEDNGGGELLRNVPRNIPSVWVKYSLLVRETRGKSRMTRRGAGFA